MRCTSFMSTTDPGHPSSMQDPASSHGGRNEETGSGRTRLVKSVRGRHILVLSLSTPAAYGRRELPAGDALGFGKAVGAPVPVGLMSSRPAPGKVAWGVMPAGGQLPGAAIGWRSLPHAPQPPLPQLFAPLPLQS